MQWFEVPGDPVGKGRPRFGAGRVYTPPKTAAYERMVAQYGSLGLSRRLEGPVFVVLLLSYGMPKSWSKKKKAAMLGAYKVGKPDIDNAGKAILDGLNGIAYEDDDQVAGLLTVRVWGEEGFAKVWVGERFDQAVLSEISDVEL